MDASLMGAGLPKFGKNFPCAQGARDPVEKRAERMKGRRARDVVASLVKGAFVGGVNRRVGFLALNGFPKKETGVRCEKPLASTGGMPLSDPSSVRAVA